MLYIKGLCEDAVSLKKGDEDNSNAICLVKVGWSILPLDNVGVYKVGKTNIILNWEIQTSQSIVNQHYGWLMF